MADLKAYQEMINEKANADSPEILPNAGADHAAIVMAKMFEKTRESVRMVVGSLEGPISNQDNYVLALKDCLKNQTENKVKFEIIFLNDPNPDSKAYQLLRESKAAGGDISFYRGSEHFKTKLSKNGKQRHFSVFDDDKYRLEKDIKKFLAYVCFNDKKNAGELLGVFDAGLKTATPII